jgi:excisionase family DNA binding protein
MKNYISIQKAANFLGMSTKTLRRWDSTGKMITTRTVGNHRRYDLNDILFLKELRKKQKQRKYIYSPKIFYPNSPLIKFLNRFIR